MGQCCMPLLASFLEPLAQTAGGTSFEEANRNKKGEGPNALLS